MQATTKVSCTDGMGLELNAYAYAYAPTLEHNTYEPKFIEPNEPNTYT